MYSPKVYQKIYANPFRFQVATQITKNVLDMFRTLSRHIVGKKENRLITRDSITIQFEYNIIHLMLVKGLHIRDNMVLWYCDKYNLIRNS